MALGAPGSARDRGPGEDRRATTRGPLMRVLVVEDEAPMAASIQRGLVAEGFAVDVAADGDEGLWMARQFPYDLIVLDVMLPGTNGYVVCRTLREEGDRVPILMLTAKRGDLDEAEGLE